MSVIKEQLHKKIILLFFVQLVCGFLPAQTIKTVQQIFVDSGWANNSINTVVFRKNSLCTFKETQYISFYNKDGNVVLGKRQLGSTVWKLSVTSFRGNVSDAHNSISMMVDGYGYLHLAWDHHNNQLHYSKSVAAGSLEMEKEISMTGKAEKNVTYPEFYRLPNGNLLFLYRNGESGNGNLVINRYDTRNRRWTQLHNNLIDGEGKRNAYWQACIDNNGVIHLSWVWRESADVSSNHDLCYAKSSDGGVTWQTSANKKYNLPITASSAEYICKIPMNSGLINQTSMYANNMGQAFVASYWKDSVDTIPQYHIIYHSGIEWKKINTGFRKTGFNLGGAGTKRIPISRPQIISYRNGLILIFRDEERGNKVSAATINDINSSDWKVYDLNESSVGSWEPTYDTELWKRKRQLHLFVQYTDQKDAEGKVDILPQPVTVLEAKISSP